jgi:CDP-glucose 4,6-dehydratase
MLDQNFWRGKKVFITGHTGFKGSWLCMWLNHWGAQVTGYALAPPTNPSLFELAGVEAQITSIHGDIRDRNKLINAIENAAPDIIFHMAAQAIVRESYKDPVATYETNVMGTVNLLESVRQTDSVKAVVNITTDKCYENKECVWGYRENDPMGGYDPYSNSKACSELVTASYRSSFFNPQDYARHGVGLATARAGNVIGGGDWAADRLIPDCIKSLLNAQPVLIRNPHAIRPWQHVLEPLCGYIMLAQKLYEDGSKYAEAWNFGPEDTDARPVEWIVQQICQKWSNGASYCIDKGEHPHEACYLKLDCSKAKWHLGWQPRWSLEKALEKIIEWAHVYHNGGDIKQVCLDQIREHTSQPMN